MPGWRVQPAPTVRNIRALPKLHEVCERHGVSPVYLVTHPVATQAESVAVLRELAPHSEIGAHLHAWTCPPTDGEDVARVSYQKDYPRERQRAKLEELTRVIEASFGVRPTSHRAGRFGIDGVGLELLAELGYEIDSSIAPLKDCREDGGPDFRDCGPRAYFPSRADARKPGDLPILELPVSATLTRRLPRAVQSAYVRLPRWTRVRGLLSKDFLGWLDLFWIYPTQYTVPEMVRAAETLRRMGAEAWVVFLHSSEFEPGMSPYTHSTEDVEGVLDRLDGFLSWARGEGSARASTLTDFARTYTARRNG
ncbi:MAG: hypothetical protein H6834_07045 [Planctomycetes bacterium]|nr:hypothetical protein [Planctomycetota bacterium]MCB9891573.1 hypothetical protein [Planctomycetota bacterium]